MLQKRLDYGFNGYNVPFFPKAMRSSRRRAPLPKEDEDQMSAFHLLATVAGELLQGETSRDACPENEGHMDVESPENKGNTDVGLVVSSDLRDTVPNDMDIDEKRYKVPDLNEIVEQCDEDTEVPKVFTVGNSDTNGETQLVKNEVQNTSGSVSFPKVFTVGNSDTNGETPLVNSEVQNTSGSVSFPKVFTMVNSDMNGETPMVNNEVQNTSGSVSSTMDGMKNRVFSGDDDENSSVCRQASTITTVRPQSRIGDRRIRRILASKHWSGSHVVKNRDLFDTIESCSLYRRRKFGYKHRRSKRMYSFKNRRCSRYRSSPNSVDINRKGGCDSSKNVDDIITSDFGLDGPGVKLKIKSFRVPEFVIEMPKTATVGSLKRSVTEAVKALLREGLRVGVIVQGKKVKDDSITLMQSGIDKVGGSLGVCLEPNSSYNNVPVSSEDNSLVLDTEPLSRCNQGVSNESSYNRVTNMTNLMESDHDSVPSHTEMSSEKGKNDSRALSALPEGGPQALTAAPDPQKSTEIGQRRIRRPFSISEVEKLVQAVEELGTGRWRDVKQHAFDDVKHRTYVDLKDKWKTLVHTAKISPQQRRGQPVPQQLLDRVLATHEFWSRQPKPQPACPFI